MRRLFRSAAAAMLSALALAGCSEGDRFRRTVLVPDGGPELVVMDFSRPMPLSPPPDGWLHRRFWTRSPMAMSFAEKDDVPALRFATAGTASMLFRHLDAAIERYPVLAWRWYIEQPIESPLDERTREGDDHPARLFLTFRGRDGADRSLEIVWGNKVLKAGDWKWLGTFPHFAADGGAENVGTWRTESVDLRALYRHAWGEPHGAHLIELAVFCDSDETRSPTVAYVAEVRLRRGSP